MKRKSKGADMTEVGGYRVDGAFVGPTPPLFLSMFRACVDVGVEWDMCIYYRLKLSLS